MWDEIEILAYKMAEQTPVSFLEKVSSGKQNPHGGSCYPQLPSKSNHSNGELTRLMAHASLAQFFSFLRLPCDFLSTQSSFKKINWKKKTYKSSVSTVKPSWPPPFFGRPSFPTTVGKLTELAFSGPNQRQGWTVEFRVSASHVVVIFPYISSKYPVTK